MYQYKKGDTCPFCGQIIQTDNEDSLRLLSVTAAACRISPLLEIPADEPKKYLCTISRCDFNDKKICCRQCSERHMCDEVCLNSFARCGLAKVME